VIDLTKQDIGVPVVKVVVPGLEVQGHATASTPGRRARERMENPTP
jgi:ribosomal protein S12 methylthiotransferase accessory factor YcaO